MKNIVISICNASGWHDHSATVTEEDMSDCYALPKETDRIEYWRNRTALALPNGHALVWYVQ